MSGPFKRFKTNEKKLSEGVWVDLGGFEFKLKRAGSTNKPYADMMERLVLKPFARAMKAGTVKDEVITPIMAKVFATTIITDWRSDLGDGKVTEGVIADENGEPLEFSVENCERILVDLPELMKAVQAEAGNLENFLHTELDEDVKN